MTVLLLMKVYVDCYCLIQMREELPVLFQRRLLDVLLNCSVATYFFVQFPFLYKFTGSIFYNSTITRFNLCLVIMGNSAIW